MLTAAAVALFVTAGNWQRDRMHAKEALRARYDAASTAQPIALPGVASEREWAALRYQPVRASGHFDASRQIFVDNRVHEGQAGYEVVAPFALDDGRYVLVDRGWVAQGTTRAVLPDAAPPAGRVTINGRIEIPARGYFELSHDIARGALWQHLDPERFTQITGLAVPSAVIEQTMPATPADDLVRDRAPPDLGIERHQIYMVQWYSFAALAIALWLYFALRRRPTEAAASDE